MIVNYICRSSKECKELEAGFRAFKKVVTGVPDGAYFVVSFSEGRYKAIEIEPDFNIDKLRFVSADWVAKGCGAFLLGIGRFNYIVMRAT